MNVTISSGMEESTVPDLVGLTSVEAARVALADLARPERAANAAVTLLQWLADRAGATA